MTDSIITRERDSRKAAAQAALGNIGTYASTSPETLDILRGAEPSERIISRYALQSGARDLLSSKILNGCHRYPTAIANHIDILRSKALKKTCYCNLQTCKSVWQCPVCAAKITERRRVELERAVSHWRDVDGVVLLVTYTVQHWIGDDLTELKRALLAARRDMLSGRAAKPFNESWGVLGRVRALEVTLGDNGWHPHIHELVFCDRDVDVNAFEAALMERWDRATRRQGLRPINSHGVDVIRTYGDIQDYVAKFGMEPSETSRWTVADEVTKQPVKRGRSGGLSMMELLAAYVFKRDLKAGAAWKQYALAFKGERQLRWTGRDLILPDEEDLTDEQIMERTEEEMSVFAQLTLDDWRVVVGNDARADVLVWARSGDYAYLRDGLRALGCKNVPDSLRRGV